LRISLSQKAELANQENLGFLILISVFRIDIEAKKANYPKEFFVIAIGYNGNPIEGGVIELLVSSAA